MLYTDGLVEDRATSVTVGMERLRAIATPLARDAEGVCQALMSPREAGMLGATMSPSWRCSAGRSAPTQSTCDRRVIGE